MPPQHMDARLGGAGQSKTFQQGKAFSPATLARETPQLNIKRNTDGATPFPEAVLGVIFNQSCSEESRNNVTLNSKP